MINLQIKQTDKQCVNLSNSPNVYYSMESKKTYILPKQNFIPEFIDLNITNSKGEKVLWASCNIGATKPEEYGKYFQWGDIIGYEGNEALAHSTWATAPFNGENTAYSQTYWASISANTIDKNYNLKPEYDAVTLLYGENYRIPTDAENTLLTANTISTWETVNGINGRRFTSKVDDTKSIFVPAAGKACNGAFVNQGEYQRSWSSTIYRMMPNTAWVLFFGNDCVSTTDSDARYNAHTIRPVKIVK